MIQYDKRIRLFAAFLSALAGFVDAIGFMHLGGFFVSFMSGNSTRLGVGIASSAASTGIAAGLIATFISGVVMGSVLGHRASAQRRPFVLVFVALLLAMAATCSMVDAHRAAVIAMTLAMGAENAIFGQEDEAHIGLTYMTGALVKVGQGVSTALLGGDRLCWLPYLVLWFGLVIGAFVGALVYLAIGLNGLWIAAVAAGIFAFVALNLSRSNPHLSG